MKKMFISKKRKKGWLIIMLTGIFLGLFTCFLADIVRARVINVDKLVKQLEEQREKQIDNPRLIQKIAVQRGFEYEKGLDFKCLSWSTYPVSNGWTNQIGDRDFILDFYIPPDKKAIICTTPILAAALTAETHKPFLYEVYPTDYGLHIRITIGLSEVGDACQSLTGNINCANSILSRQVIVRHEP
ncbi:hypothetical protein OGM63_02890 [Plectonema radiosum NIES-515]|uniref:Uncharacterized protein n=1 Tax=Plectonema radiosum NIES-515 TaxID=2986073 RepID=A0ABT3ATN7_9CYAN|nr:hypothetical protein [Plectonema radiosum]MCV3212487.1 hypothetical protein [Plectonema radiosum NIES-515]